MYKRYMDSRQFPSRQKPHYYGHTNYNSLPTTRLPPLQQQRPFYRERYCNSEKYPPRPVSMIAISNSLGYATLRKGLNIYKKIGISNNQHSNRTPPPTYYQTILNKERSQKSYSVFDNMISSSQSLADIHLATLVPNIPNHYQHLERAYNPVIIAAAKKHNMPINSHYPSSSTYFPVSSPSTSTITNLPIETSFVESQKYTYRRNSLAEAYDNAIQLPELSLYEKTPSSLNLSTTIINESPTLPHKTYKQSVFFNTTSSSSTASSSGIENTPEEFIGNSKISISQDLETQTLGRTDTTVVLHSNQTICESPVEAYKMRMLRRRAHNSGKNQNIPRDESCGAINRIKAETPSAITLKMDNNNCIGNNLNVMRSQTQKIRERRSRSQPLFQQNVKTTESDEEDINNPQSSHVSRAIRHSIDSEGYGSGSNSTVSSGIVDESYLMQAEAVWDHLASQPDELPFNIGDLITILDCNPNTPGHNGFWYGLSRDRTGWFPSSYVRVKNGTESLKFIDCGGEQDDFPQAMRYQRRKIIEELLKTEKDYVKLLQNIVFGFLDQCRRRTEMFSKERVIRIFGNIEQICLLHCKLLKDLESCIDHKQPENSCISKAFLRNCRNFTIYSEYCNNRPVSCAELVSLEQNKQYHQFFEACRLLRGMCNLPLEGFLLTPVQRICRYPLQLLELMKSTPNSHPDKENLEKAHKTMRAVASHINDSQRRIDGIQKIIMWQRNVIGFRGPDLIENNHKMMKNGELQCRAVHRGSIQWNKTVNVFLFDQSIVICKKDVLKKGALIFKERMSMQSILIHDLPDGKDSILGCNLKNAFKLSSPNREYYFNCSDGDTKKLWLEVIKSRPDPMPPSNAERRLALVSLIY
uniref:SH3 domain-containing protein n=1 Tax=Parastrongyloides trichosuri TaxID=131310 RepID=A0A0N4ZRK8_PARTI